MHQQITAKKPRKKYLTDVVQLRKYLNSLINKFENGELEVVRFRALIYACRTMNELMTGLELEIRLQNIEKKVEEVKSEKN